MMGLRLLRGGIAIIALLFSGFVLAASPPSAGIGDASELSSASTVLADDNYAKGLHEATDGFAETMYHVLGYIPASAALQVPGDVGDDDWTKTLTADLDTSRARMFPLSASVGFDVHQSSDDFTHSFSETPVLIAGLIGGGSGSNQQGGGGFVHGSFSLAASDIA